MPTISQLAPATAASDSDELIISQAGTTRKVTRAQMLAGVQAQLSAPSGSLLGRASKNVGAAEVIAVGENLVLSGGTLSASATPFVLATQESGVVPASGDLIGIGQAGRNAVVTYRQFLSGLPSVPNIDASQTVVIPTGQSAPMKLGDLTARFLSRDGGTVSGILALANDPTEARHAVTKHYVDGQFGEALPLSGGVLSGPLTLQVAPTSGIHAATKGYVDAVSSGAVPRAGGTLSGPLSLSLDPVTPMHAATKQYVDRRVVRDGDTMTGYLSLADDPLAEGHAVTKRYVDQQVNNALPLVGGTMKGPLVLSAAPTTTMHPATKQYVDARVVRAGDTFIGPLVLAADPVAMREAATKQYVDNRVARTGDTLSGPLALAGDPTANAHAATKSYVDGKVQFVLSKSGGTLSGALALSGDPASSMHAATKGYVDALSGLNLPIAGGTLAGNLSVLGVPTGPQHAVTKAYVDNQSAVRLPLAGGTLTGALTLSEAASSPLHAISKAYVDANPGRDGVINVKLPPYNAKLDGIANDTGAFKAAYQAAPAGSAIYVPNGTANIQSPGSWGIPLTKRVKWIVDGTVLPSGVPLGDCIPDGGGPAAISLPGLASGHSGRGLVVSQAGSEATDLSAFHVSYLVNHNGGSSGVISNSRTDTIIYNSPRNFVWSGLDRLVWAGVQSPAGAPPAQHVARYIQSIRQTAAADANGEPLKPQPEVWAACLEYRDHTNKPSSATGASLVVEMDWMGNGADDADNRTIQSLVIGQANTAGEPVELGSVVQVTLFAGHVGQVQRAFVLGVPFSKSLFDTTYATQLPGANAIRLAAGHSIAFEATGSARLAYDSAVGALRWYQGASSQVIGKGITVGWQSVASGNLTLLPYLVGNIIFLVGSGGYTVSLPAARLVAAGTGYTFSTLGAVAVSISPIAGEGIDGAPVVLRQHDRYHIVSDGVNSWREVFRTNAVSPRFSAPPVLPSYVVAALPTSVAAGAKAFASNGRKPNEGAVAGTGVEVFFDGIRWVSVCSGSQVTA